MRSYHRRKGGLFMFDDPKKQLQWLEEELHAQQDGQRQQKNKTEDEVEPGDACELCPDHGE